MVTRFLLAICTLTYGFRTRERLLCDSLPCPIAPSAVFAPLNYRWSTAEVAAALADVRSAALFVDEANAGEGSGRHGPTARLFCVAWELSETKQRSFPSPRSP